MRLIGCLLLLCTSSAFALDKQGSAHAGQLVSTSREFNVSGTVLLGVAPYNPSYAARPDNTGLTLLRYGAHLDVDLFGPLLSIPIDVSFFSDRERPGALVLAPSEFDVIAGLTSSFPVGPGGLEFGARVEHDRPVDRGTFTQTYVDARARFLYSMAAIAPKLADALQEGDITGWATLGWFVVNPTYAARPDNTGNALLRYALHSELSMFSDLVSLGLDGTFFTDRMVSAVAPTELDFTAELIFHKGPFEVHLAYERDMPVDRAGLVQQFVYLLGAFSFDLRGALHRAFSHTNQVVSP